MDSVANSVHQRYALGMSTETSEPIALAQCRAARALLDWNQEVLAEQANVGLSVVRDFEAGRRTPRRSSMLAMRTALEKGGIEFLEVGEASAGGGLGVRLKPKGRKTKG